MQIIDINEKLIELGMLDMTYDQIRDIIHHSDNVTCQTYQALALLSRRESYTETLNYLYRRNSEYTRHLRNKVLHTQSATGQIS